jgi:hypothetical protein
MWQLDKSQSMEYADIVITWHVEADRDRDGWRNQMFISLNKRTQCFI